MKTELTNTDFSSGGFRFFGRESELGALRAATDAGPAVVVLNGAAGSGKSALARAFLSSTGASSIAWCDLEACTTLGAALAVVLRALSSDLGGPEGEAGASARIAEVLEGRPVPFFLVLDNAESVASELGRALGYWRSATGTTLIVTSRHTLPGIEQTRIEVGPLALENAVRLIRDRARIDAADPRMRDGDELERLATHYDCLPLALELVAPKLRLLAPADWIRRSAEGGAGALDRAIERSWSLLSSEEQAVLGGCSTFRGEFSAAAVEAVLGAEAASSRVLDVLVRLGEQSLLSSGTDPDQGPEPRLRLLRVVGDFVARRRPPEPALLERHARYYLEQGERDVEAIESREERAATRRLRAELRNLRAALDYTRSAGDAQGSIRLGLVCHIAQQRGGPFDDQRELTEAIAGAARALGEPVLLSRCLLARARVARWEQDTPTSLGLLAEASALSRGAGDTPLLARIQRNLAAAELSNDGTAAAETALREALELARKDGDASGEVNAWNGLGYVHLERGELGAAEQALRRADEMARSSEIPGLCALVASALSEVLTERGRLDEAERELGRSIEYFESLHYGRQAVDALLRRARLRCCSERAGAEADAEAALRGARDLGLRHRRGEALATLASCRLDRRDPQGALEKLRDALPLVAPERRNHWLAYAALASRMAGDAAGAEVWLGLRRPAAPSALESQLARLAAAEPKSSEPAQSSVSLEARWLDALSSEGEPARAGTPKHADPRLTISNDGRTFLLSATDRLDLGRRRPLRAILLRLCAARRERPGEPVALPALLEAGWPGERMVLDSGARRLYVTVNRLRKLGLERWLLTTGDGYLLSRELEVVHEGELG